MRGQLIRRKGEFGGRKEGGWTKEVRLERAEREEEEG